MAAFVVSNLFGLARSVLVAHTFGTGLELEAFTPANRVSEVLFTLVAGGALASAFIPTFTGLLAKEDRKGAWNLASAVANWILILAAAASLIAALFAEPITRYLLVPGFADDPVKLGLTVDLLRLMLPTVVIFGISGLVMGILNAHQKFLVPALTPVMYSLGQIFGVLVLAPTMGIYGLAWGVLIGAVLHLGLQIPALLQLKGTYSPMLGLSLEPVREVGRLIGPRLFGVAIVQLNFWVNIVLASRSIMLDGSINAVSYAFTLMLMPQAAIAQSIAIAAMPTLSAQFARGQLGELRSSLAAALRGVLLLSIPASAGLIILRKPIVALLYQRGEFTSYSTELVAWALLWFAAGLVAHAVVEILARAFYSLHDTKTPVIVGGAAMTLNILLSIGLSFLFSQVGWMPHGGLALANTLATALEMVGLLVLMRRRLQGLQGKSVWKSAFQGGAATVVMGLALWAWLGYASDKPSWLIVLVGFAVGVIVYGTAVTLQGPAEVRGVVDMFRQRLVRNQRTEIRSQKAESREQAEDGIKTKPPNS